MSKIEDSINTLEDLDEFTNYILNPENQDSIIEVCDPTHVETDKLYVHINSMIRKSAFERMLEIVTGELEYTGEENSELSYEDIGLSSNKSLTVQGTEFKLF